MELTSPAGKLTMSVLSAVAEFERDLLIERTQAGIARARAEGKTLGRLPARDSRRMQRYPHDERTILRQFASLDEMSVYLTAHPELTRSRPAQRCFPMSG